MGNWALEERTHARRELSFNTSREVLAVHYLPMKSSLPGSSSYTSKSTASLSHCSTGNSNTCGQMNPSDPLFFEISSPLTSFQCGSVVLLIVFVLYSTLPCASVNQPSLTRMTRRHPFTFDLHERIAFPFSEKGDVRFHQIACLIDNHSHDTLAEQTHALHRRFRLHARVT